MTRLLKVSLLLLFMTISTTVALAQRVVVQGDNVCIRASATLNADNKIGHENRGATFKYMGSYGAFNCINYHGVYGYVHKDYSIVIDDTPAPTATRMVHVKGKGVRIRTAPSLKGKIVGSVNWGDYFPYIRYVDGWYEINYHGQIRYISADFSGVE